MPEFKFPPRKMPIDELVNWIFENDYKYWAREYAETEGRNPQRIKEIFDEQVYDLIDYVVSYEGEYDNYILHEESKDEE